MTSKTLTALVMLFVATTTFAQSNPAITAWLQNTTGIMGRHYVSGNPTPINDNILANVQKVEYSSNWVYVRCTGIPAYIIGPFLDGNPTSMTATSICTRCPSFTAMAGGCHLPSRRWVSSRWCCAKSMAKKFCTALRITT